MTKFNQVDQSLADSSDPSELQNFITDVLATQAGGGIKRKQKAGSVELSPLIVSILTLGMRVASDPKLSKMFDKHRKVQGGNSDNVASDLHKSIIGDVAELQLTGGTKTRQNNKNVKHGGSDNVEGGAKSKSRALKNTKGGTLDSAPFDVSGGAQKPNSRNNKKPVASGKMSNKGGAKSSKNTKENKHSDMKMLDNVEKSLKQYSKLRSSKNKKHGGYFEDDMSAQDVMPQIAPAIVSPETEALDLQPLETDGGDADVPVETPDEVVADESVDMSEVPEVVGGSKVRKSRAKTVKKTKNVKGGNTDLLNSLLSSEMVSGVLNSGGAKPKAKPKAKSATKKGGSEYLLED
jgi:hypothetical protein